MATTKSSIKSKKIGISEMRLALAPDTSFKDIVAVLEKTLTIPELPGIRGCRPCLSGLDRFVIEDLVMRGIR
jgi:hypothetical protein